jgi:hypothetical protein
MLQNHKNAYSQPLSRTVADLESPLQLPLQPATSDQMLKSPMSIVHVRHDWDVTTKAAENGERVPRHETSFD